MSPTPPYAICTLNISIALDRVLIVTDLGDGISTTDSADAHDRPPPRAGHELGRRGLGRPARGRFNPPLGAPAQELFFHAHSPSGVALRLWAADVEFKIVIRKICVWASNGSSRRTS